jgi:hypothetical protein
VYVSVSIQLGPDQTISNTPNELAAEILAACEGDPELDYCTVQIISLTVPGTAGTSPTTPGAAAATRAVTEIPHFSLPFRFGPTAAVVEQDSVEEIADCIVSVLLVQKPRSVTVVLEEDVHDQLRLASVPECP